MPYARENSACDIFTRLRMALTSIGFGHTCSRSTVPRSCASTSFMPSIRSAPKLFFFPSAFFRILLRSLQMSRDLPQFFLLVRRQVSLDILGVAADQVNTGGD